MEQSRTAARAGLYRLLALALSYPDRVFLDAVRAQDYQDAVARCVAACGGREPVLPDIEAPDEDIEAAYLQLFEVSGDGSRTCTLREGRHVAFTIDERLRGADDGAPTLLEDLLRFYHFFGLKLTDDPAQKLPPDHIACQLEMLSRLCGLEGAAGQAPDVVRACRSAQRDFLARHVARWWPQVTRGLRATQRPASPHEFYVALAELCLASLGAHLNELDTVHQECGARSGRTHAQQRMPETLPECSSIIGTACDGSPRAASSSV